MADPYKFSFDVAAFLEEQEVADTSVAPKEGVMKKPEAPVEEAPMSNTDRLKKRFADTVSSFYSGTQEIRDKYNKAQETNPLLGRDAAQSEWMKALSTPAVTTTALGPDMDTMAMQDAQEQVAMRSASGITESLGRPAPAGLGNAPAQPETPVIYEAAATVTNGADSVVDRTAPAGLMTRPVQGAVSEVDTDTAVAEAMATPVPEKRMPEPFVYDENEQQDFEARKEIITNLGASFDTASRDDVRVLQKTLRDMEGPTKVDVGGIDGRWGKKGRNALWAFQLRAGISPTGEMDEDTAKALNSPADYLDPRVSAVDASALDTPASKMLVGVEALKLMPYELNSSRQGRSGLTFGAGIDVGQHTAARLKRDFNFTDDMIEEFGVYNAETNPSGWIGRNPAHPSKGGQGGDKGTAARNRVHAEMATEYRRQREAGELPSVSEKWIAENVRPVYDLYVNTPKRSYNNLYGSGAWDELPEEAQAIAVLENYRGDGVNNAQMRLLNAGNYVAAARAAKKSSRAPAMIKILNSYGHQ